MKKTILIAATLLLTAAATAAPVAEATARQVALNFWNTYRPLDAKPVYNMQTLTFSGLEHMYVFTNDTLGFVIVAADDRVRPVLGYSFDNPFPTRLHRELQYWLSGYEEQIARAVETEGEPHPRWNTLLTATVPPEPVSLQFVEPLCLTTWDQGNPYNKLCPYDSTHHDRTVVGCVATAMAQIMKRWNHPSCGTGSHSYEQESWGGTSGFGIQSADFEHTTYLWEQMPNSITIFTSEERADALATLSYHCGVAVEMMYGVSALGGSGAYTSCGSWANACAEQAFYRYFKYDSSLIYHPRYQYSDNEWMAMIDEDLAHGRPMYYNGSDSTGGHAFVLDGSHLDSTYHFNWGWSGYGNGYYALNDLAPRSGGIGGNVTYTFNSGQGAIFGIQPLPEPFDTIVVYDTICTNYETYQNHGYTLPVANTVTNLRYLDTIFELHLHVTTSDIASFSENTGIRSNIQNVEYCPADGLVLIDCPYTRDGYHFIGWSTAKSGNNDSIYQPGQVMHINGNKTIYARWKKNSDVAVDDVESADAEILIYPNPTEQYINFSITDADDVTVHIIDQWGRVVIDRKVVGRRAKISLEKLPVGTYTVMVHTSNYIYKKQIIKL